VSRHFRFLNEVATGHFGFILIRWQVSRYLTSCSHLPVANASWFHVIVNTDYTTRGTEWWHLLYR